MIAIVNYGLGNIQAFVNIYRRLNIPVVVASRESELQGASKVILPGVGAFDWAMNCLNDSGMRASLNDLVLERNCPVLGICVGMQIMARRSDEGMLSGLGWIDAEVKKFDQSCGGQRAQLPHMGWNDVAPQNAECLFRDMLDPRFYFLHSYYFLPSNPGDTLAVTNYGGPFASAVRSGNIFGTQFHPEKSHHWGVQLLKNFAEV